MRGFFYFIILFYYFSEFSKTHIFTLASLSINDGHVKNILRDVKQYMI